ncbi:hypothetical protein K1T71_014017 [Dendrolimus kikuchii]|uniref:Uncharacterized protein n=1 Tax=Dendrolimus kikuchii TaxID=765133 RepID=A0ACC1CGM4_9NEOP|nr:hypothetical protein K1T71_014017 [Dendrolimus kikuchii]
MGSVGPSSVLLIILNVIHFILSLALTATAIWFFVEVQTITSLRNTNHYLLDYNVYWPQAIPWVFMLVGIIVLFVSCCGFVGAKKKSRGFIIIYATFEGIAILALIIAAIVALTCADSTSTDSFVKDAIWDVYSHSTTDTEIQQAFGNVEKRLQCCGAGGPRDYKSNRNEFPISCCDTYYHGWIGSYNIDCDFTNKLANERHGCAEVATNYVRVVIRVLAGASIFTAFVGIMNLIVAAALSIALKRKPRVQVTEMDSKKGLL